MKCSHHVKNTSTIILIMIPSDQNISQLKPRIEIILIDKLNAKVRQELLLIIGETGQTLATSLAGELPRRSHIKCRVTMNLVDHGLKRSKNLVLNRMNRYPKGTIQTINTNIDSFKPHKTRDSSWHLDHLKNKRIEANEKQPNPRTKHSNSPTILILSKSYKDACDSSSIGSQQI